ncbi:hypothetical protein [Saccharothrix xinjiangensis]|uniref:Uncharacterized protein n=1 Tax=Saccharothrix xinjiangensis TaxID=204798 RepID=A0ABV9XX80_9PSEU
MGRVVWRYGWAAVVGAVLGGGWWWYLHGAPGACGGEVGCGVTLALAAPLVPVASWVVGWGALRLARVERPAATAAAGVGVAALLTVAGATGAVPVAAGAVSFLIGGMLVS